MQILHVGEKGLKSVITLPVQVGIAIENA